MLLTFKICNHIYFITLLSCIRVMEVCKYQHSRIQYVVLKFVVSSSHLGLKIKSESENQNSPVDSISALYFGDPRLKSSS